MVFYEIAKRILDIIGSVVGIILFSPIMIGTAIFIKLVSPDGPIFADIPMRVGRHGTMFRFLKFRSMFPNAHEMMLKDPELSRRYKENGYKLDPDPRLIKGGKFMRKFSIDELPQFFNVLLGDMSLVGFRAYFKEEIEEQMKKYPEAQPYLKSILSAKPGITGLWQISGRAELSFLERIKLDAEYATKRSILLDILIILKTPYVVVKGQGAY